MKKKNQWDGGRPNKHLDGNNESALRYQIIWVYLTDDRCEDFWTRKYQNIIQETYLNYSLQSRLKWGKDVTKEIIEKNYFNSSQRTIFDIVLYLPLF